MKVMYYQKIRCKSCNWTGMVCTIKPVATERSFYIDDMPCPSCKEVLATRRGALDERISASDIFYTTDKAEVVET